MQIEQCYKVTFTRSGYLIVCCKDLMLRILKKKPDCELALIQIRFYAETIILFLSR